jgi:hypothetical protein
MHTAWDIAANAAEAWPAGQHVPATHLVEADLAGFQEVVQPAGRGDDDLHAVLQVPQLPVLRRATVAAPVQSNLQALTN